MAEEKPLKDIGKQQIKLNAQIVEGFAGSCLTQFFDNASQFEDFHREWWEYCCSSEKFVAICAPRG